MITTTDEHSFDDPDFELRIKELLYRRAEEVDLSGLPAHVGPSQGLATPSRVKYVSAFAALTLLVSSAFFIQFGRQSGDATESNLAHAIENETPAPISTEEPTPGQETQPIEMVDVQGIMIHADFADQLEALLVDAKAAGFELSGAGYRSSADQVERRKQNCGTTNYEIYEKPASECFPPTAIPGTSKHEQGSAVDFIGDDGSTLTAASPAYEWLTANADTYGVVGKDDEPWHWEFGEPESPAEDKPPASPEVADSPQNPPAGDSRVVSIPDEDLRTVNGIVVHVDIAESLQAMIDAARVDGIELTGGGYRDPADQIERRRQHCGPTDYDIYEKPASQCSPPTARPGSSMHDRGLAVDFLQSDGGTITRESPEYAWLTANAERYGLSNFPLEPWHWSTNGE